MAAANVNESRTQGKWKEMKHRIEYRANNPVRSNNQNNRFSQSHTSFRGTDKDSDDERNTKGVRSRRKSPDRARSSQTKELERSDKLETLRRLEREKKIIQKKNRDEDQENEKRPVFKERRMVKDWTKGYEYGLLDEEDNY